ncbi:hypothetical protein KI688_007882 [Linnemannia hyalina]|uniref:Uncharacterized protein n=1 Tax=Linnemannia hyalina TaxID=64524 RepID=A0A9P8BM89_9FUNG|nr:hypothetical protein KI688_007882 [Linnemannia hyalina]
MTKSQHPDKINGYFKSDISRSDLGDYLICSGQSDTAFLNDLADLQNIKRLPGDISMFAHALYKYYEGDLGKEKVELVRVNAHKELGTPMLNSMELISLKMAAGNELDLEIAGGCSPQIEPCNPFLVPPPITTSSSALSPRNSTARPAVSSILSNASLSTSTSSISGVTTAKESTGGVHGAAKDHCLVAGFEDHACNTILVVYLPVMHEKGAEYLHRRLITDRGKFASDYLDGPSLSPTAVLRDQVLHILLEICYGEISEAYRKVDFLLAFESIELSNVEFKLRDALDKEIAILNRKNIRLAHALQEAHGRHGAGDVSVYMADVIALRYPTSKSMNVLKYARAYCAVLEEYDLEYLIRKLAIDRGQLLSSHPLDENLTKAVVTKEKVLRVLEKL